MASTLKTTKTDRENRAARRATNEQVAGVRRLVRENVAAVEHLEAGAVRPTLEVLLRARQELRDSLTEWMRTVKDPTDKFTGHQMRVMLRSLEEPINTLGIRFKDMIEPSRRPFASALDRSMLAGLEKGAHAVGALSVKNLESEIVRLGHIFGDSLIAPQIKTASVIARGDKLLLKKFPTSAARYAGKVGEDLRFQLAVGVARGETFEQLAQRLRRLAGPVQPVGVRGIFDHPEAITRDIPNAFFQRYKGAADRLVRTEMMSAYNVQHRIATEQLNSDRPEGSPEWQRRCDESVDGRTCRMCMARNGEILKGDGPPWHPNCRGVEIAWRADWPEIRDLSHGIKDAAERSSVGV